MRVGPWPFILVWCVLGGVGCDDVRRAEVEEARAEVELARAELREARRELVAATEGVEEARRELKVSRRARVRAELRAGRVSSAGSSSPPPDPEAGQALVEAAAAAIACIDDVHCTITRAFVDQALADPSQLSRQARIVPYVQGGETRGLRFYAIRPGSIPRLLGIRNGDTLTAVNELPLTGVDAALEAYTKVRDEERFVFKLMRRGEPLELQVDITDGPRAE